MAYLPPFIKRLWSGWKRIAVAIAHFQGHLILGLIYVLLLAPIACLFRLFGQDALALSDKDESTYWSRRNPIGVVAEFLKRMY